MTTGDRSTRSRYLWPSAAAILVAVSLSSCAALGDRPSSGTPAPGTSSGGSSGAPTVADVVAKDLEAPWAIAFDGDTALLSERDSGRILELGDDGTPRELGVVDGVTQRGEGGLLGIAVHDERLYAYFTAGDENRIERFALQGAPGALRLGRAEAVLEGIPAAAIHNGGRIKFGPDGMLYVTVGDAGDREAAQDRDSLSGTILRLTPDGGIPDDNPFDGSPVYSYGHRNPQGLAWDEDGTLYASEFGQDTWDELNVIEAGGNYGWPIVEGVAHRSGFIDPVQQWRPADASPSGIAIVDGSIWIATLRGARLREVPLGDTSTSTEWLVGDYGRLRDVAQAPDGSLWVLTNNTDGRGTPAEDDDRVLRIQP